MISKKLEVAVNSSNLEDRHKLPCNGNKRFIIKLSKRKNANKILRVIINYYSSSNYIPIVFVGFMCNSSTF